MENRLKTLLIVLMTAFCASLSAAPVGYSVNSDSPAEVSGELLSDGLYSIDLETGNTIERIGTVQSVLLNRRFDVEGLAFAPDGTLYGIDDDRLKLFAISLDNALIDPDRDYDLSGLSNGKNDFGMTFACDGNLYITSVKDKSLYRVGPEGAVELVGGPDKGKLDAQISALAAFGFPVQLYGLGNGTVGENPPAKPNKLYLIDTITGIASDVGTLSGDFGPYESAGLAFDETGKHLWAITDRRQDDLPSEVLRIQKANAQVTDAYAVSFAAAESAEETWGFESLAISAPRGCTTTGNGQIATFWVQKRFTDGNDVLPVTLNFKCNGGTVFNGTKTFFPTEFDFGTYETSFQVDNVPAAPISCEVWETVPAGYIPEYSCQSEAGCTTANDGADPCVFNGVVAGQRNVCLIDNNVDPVEVKVTKEWADNITGELPEDESDEDVGVEQRARVNLVCENVFDGDGIEINGDMVWSWIFEGNPDSHVAMVYPKYDEKTTCRTEEPKLSSAIESESTCSKPTEIKIGEGEKECIVTNTVFFEGIPTLNQYGLILIAALMLLTGTVAMRRFD
jgi:hypothetical protein